MQKNIKDVIILVGIGALLVFAGIWFATGKNPFAAGGVQAPTTGGVTAPTGTVESGKSATVKLAAFDKESNDYSQVAVPLYVYTNGVLSVNGQVTSTSTRTSVTAATGDKLTIVAFNGSNYGDIKDVIVTKEDQTENADVHKAAAAADMQTRYFFEGSAVTSLTLTATETKGLDKLTIKTNAADKSFKLGAICYDLVQSSNISRVEISGLNKIATPQRLTESGNDVEGCYALPASLLTEFQTYETGAVQIVAGASEPVGEDITFKIVDLGRFISSKDQSLKEGLENDALTPADVGVSDVSATLSIS